MPHRLWQLLFRRAERAGRAAIALRGVNQRAEPPFAVGAHYCEQIGATVRKLAVDVEVVWRRHFGQCTAEEQAMIFRELRARHIIHDFERVIGAPAEMILEAIHRAPELTRRMLRGVIADSAFRTFVAATREAGR